MIICEVGLNHIGNEAYSSYYTNELIAADCDAITYQIREKEFYKNDKFLNSELLFDHYSDIINRIHKNNKKFGMALADHSLVDKCESIGVDFYKILSWDLNNYNFINSLIETKKPIYISTGMSDMREIQEFNNYHKKSADQITLIHTQLNCDIENVNLKAIKMLKNSFTFPVAFGNHCNNINVLYAATAFEPSDIFIYVKGPLIDKHPDEGHAVDLKELPNIINNIKEMNIALGSEKKIKMENYTDKENLK